MLGPFAMRSADEEWWGRLRRIYGTLVRYRWLIPIVALGGAFAGYAYSRVLPRTYYSSVKMEFYPEFNPADAATDAERDLRAGYTRFYFVGGIVSQVPGVPEEDTYLLQR